MKTVKILETVKIINDTVKKFDGIRCFLSTGDLDLTEIKSLEDVTYFDKPSRANQNVKKDDIILARMQGTVKVKIIDYDEENIIVSTGFMVLRCNKDVNNRFIFHYLKSSLFQSKKDKLCSGATQKAINNNKFAEIQIPLPNIPTQQKIATILDKAEEIRQYNKQLIAKYDALTQSLFLDMFGDIKSNSKKWNLKPFEYFVKFDTRMTSDFVKYANYPHIGIANIEKETGKLVNYKLISEENLSSGKYIFDESHIIYSKIRPNLNKVALPNFSGLCSADSYPLKVIKKNSNRIFFAYVLRSDSFVDFILTHSTRTNIPKANKEQMKKYTSIAPPLDLQNQFAERIQLIETQKQQAQEALVKSEALFQGLLQQAFKGELT